MCFTVFVLRQVFFTVQNVKNGENHKMTELTPPFSNEMPPMPKTNCASKQRLWAHGITELDVSASICGKVQNYCQGTLGFSGLSNFGNFGFGGLGKIFRFVHWSLLVGYLSISLSSQKYIFGSGCLIWYSVKNPKRHCIYEVL